MGTFNQRPGDWVPFKDEKELARVRSIKSGDITKHPRPNVHITVYKDSELEMVMLTDMFKRVMDSDRYDKKTVMIMPNPGTTYRKLAYMINKFEINCRNLKFYMMDEWADNDGNIAPESYKAGFTNSFLRFFYSQLDEKLRMPRENIIGFTNENVSSYSKMIAEDGEADIIYSGPGWPGHLAFIDPVEDWFCGSMEEYILQPAKTAHLHPMTVLQNSLHGSFGYSGDVASVPSMGAMIGPRDVMNAKHVMDVHGISTCGTKVAWQRMISRLCIHGPVCQELPASILQLRETEVAISENIASDIEPDYFFQY